MYLLKFDKRGADRIFMRVHLKDSQEFNSEN